MIYSARQLEEMHKATGSVTLPRDARFTPLAQDWIRAKKITIQYTDQPLAQSGIAATNAGTNSSLSLASSRPSTPGAILWWCDGPCGPAKAAVMAQARESNLSQLTVANDAGHLVEAAKTIAREIKVGSATGALLLVQYGASAIVYANRCPSIRAILGTCLESVEQGIQQVAANVLIIEHPYKSLSQVKNMLSRFCRGNHVAGEEVKERLKDLGACG